MWRLISLLLLLFPVDVSASLTLTWIDMSDNEDSFRIERRIGTAGTFAEIAATGMNVAQYADTTVTPGLNYCYQVLARNTAGTSPPSNIACAIAPAPLSPTTLVSLLPCLETPDPPPSTGLFASYAFSEGNGTTTADSSGNSHAGTLNGATWTTQGKYGNALSFNGSSASVALGNWNISGSGLTLTAWVRATDWKATEDVRIISKATGTQEQEHWWMLSENGGKPRFRLKAGGSTSTLVGSSTLPLTTWVHLAATYDGAIMRLYQDGGLVGSLAKTGAIDQGTASINIGRNPVGGNYFSGIIDEVRVYNRALTISEIQTEMSTP